MSRKMSDYIKREDALRAFNGIYSTVDADDILRHLHKSVDVIKNIPSADVVEVVRCNDCKHIKEEHFNIMPDGFSCELSGLMVEPERYCSYGERADK